MKNSVQKFTLNTQINVAVNNHIRQAEDVKELCDRIAFVPKQIVQIGAANNGDLEYMDFIKQGAKALLFEPHPKFYKELCEKWEGIDNITIFDIAIYKEIGRFRLWERWASSCLEECGNLLENPIDSNDKYYYVKSALMSGFDNGEIDLLLIDTEGAEWYALDHLISRPKIICIETHYIYSQYRNPFLLEIYEWMTTYGYMKYALNESDTVFLRYH